MSEDAAFSLGAYLAALERAHLEDVLRVREPVDRGMSRSMLKS